MKFVNKDDRKSLDKTIQILDGVQVELEEMQVDLQSRVDNLEEYFPESERGEKIQAESDYLLEAVDGIKTVLDDLNESMVL